ncbi:GGDEF domain-containing protein [Vallitalea okinawensis]|uniref:GGDEF domain-containing protein n=1 Tax=Vallitalea okinawensis TaxID=2078660 RepID=UPI000CFB0BF1|nr:GGDEF domain-containing protein [Vallitalea okinawensis]
MNKYFKPYLALINIIGFATIIFSSLTYPLVINGLWVILFCFSVIAEFTSIQYSSNKHISLVAPLSIVSLFFLNLTSTLFLIVTTHIAINIIGKYYHKTVDKFINDKFLFNMFCIGISTNCAYLIYQLDFNLFQIYSFYITLLLMVIVHSLVNYLLVSIVVYLYTGNTTESNFDLKQVLFSFYYFFMTSLFLIIAHKDYSYFGLFAVYIFLIPFQTKMLTYISGKELHDNLNTDQLTKAYNRYCLDKIMTDKINEKIPFTILFLDFDKFKYINDTYGHLVGDQILVHFVQLINHHVKGSYKLFRYGGDEFCIILNNPSDKELIIHQLEELKDQYKMTYENEVITYGFTIGDYTYNGEKDVKPYHILEHVDKLMYEKK